MPSGSPLRSALPAVTHAAHVPPAGRAEDVAAPVPVAAGARSPSPDATGGGMPRPALRVSSACAGVFYLLPVAVHLGWYGDFTQPRHPNLALHPADLLALLAERVTDASWCADALGPLLAAWAGRAADEPPGIGFDPGEPLQDWLAAREARLAARAAAALGWAEADVLARLVRTVGVVCLDEMRVDVHFDLGTHPLEIRIAGLDRDLGWLPAGGRSVAFHFELGLPT